MPPKRPLQKSTKSHGAHFQFLKASHSPKTTQIPACPPTRAHSFAYHRPKLLDHAESIDGLLKWFEREEHKRNMPWRQAWIDIDAPQSKRPRQTGGADATLTLHEQLKQRAYQVWISEIMLQQTRVETVKEYWQSWMDRWPTIEALANASQDDVLAAWRGLGYYSRATRIHQAAKTIVNDPELKGLLPNEVEALERKVPGVGKYTAGAISSIVFGHAVPILDGNVARVLSRQTALYVDVRAKQYIDLLWELARLLVERAAALRHGDTEQVPDRSPTPGKWNQGLMELGSTLCTPTKPDCPSCPIQRTCMAFAEVCGDHR